MWGFASLKQNSKIQIGIRICPHWLTFTANKQASCIWTSCQSINDLPWDFSKGQKKPQDSLIINNTYLHTYIPTQVSRADHQYTIRLDTYQTNMSAHVPRLEHLHQCSVCDPALEILDEVHQSNSSESTTGNPNWLDGLIGPSGLLLLVVSHVFACSPSFSFMGGVGKKLDTKVWMWEMFLHVDIWSIGGDALLLVYNILHSIRKSSSSSSSR